MHGPNAWILLAVVCGCTAPLDDDASSSADAVVVDQQAGKATSFPECVQVMVDNAAHDYCSGVLVTPTRVVTAAHCLVAPTFKVLAPNAGSGNTTRTARYVGVVSKAFDSDPSHEDVGVIELDAPIQLRNYPELRDLGELASKTFKGIAVGRDRTNAVAEIVVTKPLTIRSAAAKGYTTGLETEYFSGGGDSGGGLFLIENGAPTHVLVGLERQPSGSADFFSRVTPAVKKLIGSGASAAPSPAPSSTSR